MLCCQLVVILLQSSTTQYSGSRAVTDRGTYCSWEDQACRLEVAQKDRWYWQLCTINRIMIYWRYMKFYMRKRDARKCHLVQVTELAGYDGFINS